ncbi:MAG: rhomboid family intramembrane serine protease [Alphaproteobacteria bacterium]|nr:rhomboid family intramembrane serine protease [Alphaproteobacteria bacterium]
MFIPLHDNTPLKVIRFQLVTIAIITANLVIYAMTGAFTSDQVLVAVATGYGLVPGELTGLAAPVSGFDPIPEPLTLVTYQFLHAGWWHVISNMLFLWVFADNIEDAFGHVSFTMLYLLCGIVGGLTHVMMAPGSNVPLVGASGAVSGVIGSYVVLYPRARVWILLFMRLPLRVGAVWVLGGWFLLQLVSLLLTEDGEVGVAWWAHIGGFLCGFGITWAIRRRLLIRVGE